MSEMKIVGAEEAIKNADAMLEQNKAADVLDEYKTPISDMLATIPQYGKAGEKEQYIVGQFAKGEYTPQTDEEWNGLAPLLSRVTLGSEYDEGGRSLGIFMQTEDFTTGEEYKDVDREHGVANAKRVCETWKQWFEYARSGDAAQLKFIQDNSSDKDFYEKPLLEQERIARRALGKGDAKDWDAEHSMMTEELFDASAATQAKAEANGIMLHMSGDEGGEDGTDKTFTETAESAVDARAHADIEAYRRMVGDRYGVAKLDAAINILTVPNMDGTFGPDKEAVKLLSAFAKGRGVDSFGRLIPGDYLGLRDGALNLIEQAHAADRANGDGEDGPEYKKAWASVIRAVRAANLAYKTEGFSAGPDAGVGGKIVQEACNGLLEVEDLVSGWIDGAWNGTARAYNKVANTVWRTEAEAKDDMERRYIDDAAIMATTANVVPSSTWYGTVEREAMKFAAWGRLFGAATWTMGKLGVKAVDVGAKAATFDKAMKDIAPLQKAVNESYAAFGDAMGGVQDLAKAGEIGESILNLEKAVNDARALAIKGVGYNGWAQIVDHTRSILTQAPALLPIAMSEYESSARGGAVQMTDLIGWEEGFDSEKANISDNYALGKSAIVTGFMSAFSPLLKQMAEGTVGTSATQRAASALLGAFNKAEKNGDVTELRAWLTAFAIASAGTLSPAIHSGFMIGTQNATLAVVDEFETASLEGRPVDMDAMAARATEAGVDGATAGFLGALPAAAVGSTYRAASMKLPTIARAHKIDYSAKRVISALGGLDYDSTLRRKTYSELTDAEKARFNKGNKEFSAIIQAIVNEGDGADAAAREELLKKHGVPAHLHGTLDSLAKDVAFAAKNFKRNAITMAAVLEGSKAYSTDAEAEDYLRRAGFDAKITTGEDGVKRIELGATVRGKKVSGTFLMEHGEVLYRRDDGSYMPGAAKAIVQWTEENSGQSDIAHVAEKLAALKGDTATDADGRTKYDRLVDGEDVDGLLTEMRKKMGGKGATGVFVAPGVAKDDPNAAKATRGGAVRIEGGLIKLAEGDIETLIHEPTHALIDLMEKAGAITEDERRALEAVQGLEGWNEELTRQFGIDASGKVIAQKAVEIAAENNRGLVERIKDGAAKLLGVVRKVKAVNGNPVAMFGEFFDDAVEAAEKDAEERAVDEERGKQLEKAAAEAEKAARGAIGDPIATDKGEAGPTEEADLTLEEMAERDEIAPERREGTSEAPAAPATETPAREAERAPDALALAQEAIAYRNGISDELFEGGARGFLDEFTDGGKLTVEQVMGALGYAHDAENGVWLHRDTAGGAYDRAVAREAQRKLVAGEELSEAERRRVGVIVDGNGVMAGVGIRIDGEIDGTEEAVDENMRGLMAQAGSSWRALAVNESKEVVDAVRRQLSTETAKFNFKPGKIKDWFTDATVEALGRNEADWTKYDTRENGFNKMSRTTRLAEAVGTMDAPSEIWKVFLPTGKKDYRYKNFLIKKFDENGVDGNDKMKSGGYHMLNHIAECGYYGGKSVLTAQEMNDYFLKCLDTKAVAQPRGRLAHELRLPNGTKMTVVTYVDTVDGEAVEIPITITSDRNDYQSRGACKDAAKKMSARLFVRSSEESDGKDGQTEDSIAKQEIRVNGRDYTMLGEPLSKGAMTKHVGPGIDRATGGYPVMAPQIDPKTGEPYPGYENTQSMFNWVGRRGLANALKYRDEDGKPIVTQAKLDKIEKMAKEYYEEAVRRLGGSGGYYDEEGNYRRRVRNWMVERDLGEKGFDIGLPRVGSDRDTNKLTNRLRLHFTGAYKDNAPRFEYAGAGAKLKIGQEKSISEGGVSLQDIVKDADMKAYYPEIAEAPVVMGGKRGFALGTVTLRGLHKNGAEATKDNSKGDKIEVIVPDRTGRERMVGVSNDGVFIIFADEITKANRKQIEQDMNAAVAAAISRYEGWDFASKYGETYDPNGVFTARDWGRFASSAGRRTFFGKWLWSQSNSEFKYHLFGDAKLDMNNPDSVAAKVVQKVIDEVLPPDRKTKGRTKERREVREQIREEIVKMLNGTYEDFASVLEAKAMGARMGRKWERLSDPDEGLYDADRRGFIRARQGGWSEESSRRVIEYWQRDVAEAMARILKDAEVADMFRKYFDAEVKARDFAGKVAAAVRKVNPTGARTKKMLAAVNKERAKLGMEALTEAQWENWYSLGGTSDQVGRPAYTEEQKRIAEANAKKVTPFWNTGTTDSKTATENRGASGRGASRTGAATDAAAQGNQSEGLTIEEREAANAAVYGKDRGPKTRDTDTWKANEGKAFDELKAKFAEMNAKDADAMKAAVKEAVRIVMKYSGQGVSEQAIFERAQGLFQMITTGKKPSKRKGGAQYRFVGADFTTRMIGASASKLAYEMMRRRGRPDGMANAVEAVKAQMKKEAARLKIPQADRDLWADTVVSSAKGIAEDVVDSMGDSVDAKARDITKDILDRVEAEAEQRRISSAMYSQLLGGYVEGRLGEEAVETAHASLERERMAAIRAAKGLTVGEVNSVVGFDTIGSIVGLGSEGARFKDGAEMAKALTAGFLDGYRRANPEAATATNDELLDDPSVRREYAQTVGSLINAAAKRIAYGRERTLAARDAATLRQTLPPTLSTIERMFAHHAEMIAEGAQKLDVASLVKAVERIIDSQAAGGKRVSQNASKWERDIAPHLQEFWKYVKDVMYKSESWCADEETAIKNRLKLSEQDATDIAAENPDDATRGDDIARDLDMMKLRAIRRYGALTSRDKAEVVDVIGGDIIPGIDRATREYLEYRAQRRADDAVRKDVLIKGLKPYRDGDYKVSPKGEWKRKFLFWNMPDMFAKFSAYFKEGSDEKMLVDGMRRDFSTAHLEENRIVSDLSTRMVREIESVTGMRYDDFIAEWTKENPDWAHLSRSDYAVPSDGGRTVEVWTGRYAQRSDAKKGVKKGDKVMRTVHIAERGVDDSLTRTAQSKLSLMYAYAAAQQGDMEINNIVYSRDAAWMREVEGIIGRDGIALASRITAMYDTMRGLVSPVSERITGAAVLSPDPRYCPLFFEQRPNASMTGKFSVSKFPTFLTERERHDNARLQEGVNILDVLTRRIRDTAHYTAFGELADKVKTTFADGRVMAQYYNVLGQKTAKALYRQLNDAFNGGEESLDTMGMTLRNIVTHTTLGYNPASAIKQLEGIGGWKLMMGTRSWIGALTWDRSVFNTEVQGAMADLAGVFAARGNEGITEPMRALMAAKERNGNRGALRWYTNNSMAFTRFFDRVAVSTCAAQYYLGRLEYYRTQGVEESRYTSQFAMYKRSGWAEADARRQAMADARMTPDEAKRAAVADTDYAIQITQTSGRQEFLNEYQRSGMGGKIITQFAGPRFTRLGIEIDAAHRAFVLGEKGAKVKFLSKFFTGHVICPAILATASQMTSYLFGRRDDKNARMFDGFMANMAVAMAFGPWSGMCIIGSLLDTTTRMAVRKAMNEGGTRRAVEFPMTSKLGRMLDLSTTTAVDACRMFTADNMGKEFMRHVMWDLVDDIQALIPVTKIGNAAVNVKEMIDRYLKEAEREERRGR